MTLSHAVVDTDMSRQPSQLSLGVHPWGPGLPVPVRPRHERTISLTGRIKEEEGLEGEESDDFGDFGSTGMGNMTSQAGRRASAHSDCVDGVHGAVSGMSGSGGPGGSTGTRKSRGGAHGLPSAGQHLHGTHGVQAEDRRHAALAKELKPHKSKAMKKGTTSNGKTEQELMLLDPKRVKRILANRQVCCDLLGLC